MTSPALPGGSPPAPFRLLFLDGPDRGRTVSLPRDGEIFLGRGDSCDVVLKDHEASRRHCKIVVRAGTCRLQDLGSTNGCFVAGERVTGAALDPGARLRIGRTSFALVASGAETAAAAPSRPESETREVRLPRRRRFPLVIAGLIAVPVVVVAALLLARPAAQALAPGPRSIPVRSEPAGAEVFFDNLFVGLTPLVIQADFRAPHALRIARRGFQTWRTAINRDTPAEIIVPLRREPAATLLISASKPDTDVYLDGRLAGKTGGAQPLRIPDVPLGQHELRLLRPNYIPWQQQIDVARAGELHFHGMLESRQESSLLAAIAREPRSALLYTELGHLNMVNKQLDKAMDAYRKALELVYSRTDTSGYSSRLRDEMQKVVTGERGVFQYGSAGEAEAARQKLEDVFVSLLPRYREMRAVLTWLAGQYSARREVDSAIRVYGKMIAALPADLELYQQAAMLSMAKSDFSGAVAVLSRAVAQAPDNWIMHYTLGLAYARRAEAERSESDRAAAVGHLETALRLCPVEDQKANITEYLARTRAIKTGP